MSANTSDEADVLVRLDYVARSDRPHSELCELSAKLIRAQSAELASLRARCDAAEKDAVEAVSNEVCGELPEGWYLDINMENGYAGVDLIDADGAHIEIDDDMSLVEKIRAALVIAAERAKEGETRK